MTTTQPQNPSIVDSVSNSSIRLQYEKFTNAMQITETMGGSYLQIIRPPVGGAVALKEGQVGTVSLKANENGMISLDNTSIYFNQRLNITIPSQTDSYIDWYYVGYKDVAAIIRQYQIVSNADVVQHRTNCDYEWYLKSISKLTAAMQNNSADAILSKIRERNPHVPGVYINVKEITADTIRNVVLNLKMAVTKFLILNDLRWLADFMGTWTIHMWLSMKNIVVAPVIPEALFTKFPKIQEAMNAVNNDAVGTDAENQLVHFGFHHLNEPMRNRFKITETAGPDYGKVEILPAHTWKCDNHETIITGIDIRHFELLSQLTHELRADYKNFPLLVPITTVEFNAFSTRLGDATLFNQHVLLVYHTQTQVILFINLTHLTQHSVL